MTELVPSPLELQVVRGLRLWVLPLRPDLDRADGLGVSAANGEERVLVLDERVRPDPGDEALLPPGVIGEGDRRRVDEFDDAFGVDLHVDGLGAEVAPSDNGESLVLPHIEDRALRDDPEQLGPVATGTADEALLVNLPKVGVDELPEVTAERVECPAEAGALADLTLPCPALLLVDERGENGLDRVREGLEEGMLVLKPIPAAADDRDRVQRAVLVSGLGDVVVLTGEGIDVLARDLTGEPVRVRVSLQ